MWWSIAPCGDPMAAPPAPFRCNPWLGSCFADNTKQIYIGHENDFLEPASAEGLVVRTALGRLGLYACMDGVINEPPAASRSTVPRSCSTA